MKNAFPLEARSRSLRALLACCVLASVGTLAAQGTRPAVPPTVQLSDDLAAPSQLVAHGCGSTVELRWRDNSRAELSFVILRRTAGSRPGSFQPVGVVPADHFSFEDASVPAGAHVYRVLAHGAGGDSLPSNPARVSTPGLPPIITTDLQEDQRANRSGDLIFTVTVSDPDGDPVSLQLLNPPQGLIFDPLVEAPSPASVVVRWRRVVDLSAEQELNPRLVFESSCGVRLLRDMKLADDVGSDTAVVIGDVTGDGIQDTVASMSSAATPTARRRAASAASTSCGEGTVSRASRRPTAPSASWAAARNSAASSPRLPTCPGTASSTSWR